MRQPQHLQLSSTQGMRYSLVLAASFIVMSNTSRVHPDLDSSGKRPDTLEIGSSAPPADLQRPAALLGLRAQGILGLRRLLGLRASEGSEGFETRAAGIAASATAGSTAGRAALDV